LARFFQYQLGFRIGSKDGLVIALSIRWKRYADDPINGGTFVLGQSNCDGKVLIPLFVSADHRIAARKPLSLGFDCTSSGIIDPVSIFDHLAEGGTWIFSGGSSSSGCVEIFLNLAGLFYNYAALLDGNPIFASAPVETEVLQKDMFPFVKAILDLDQSDNEVFLSDIRFDPAGVWIIFTYPERLYELVQSLVDKVKAWI
jgi:hypothetical protein